MIHSKQWKKIPQQISATCAVFDANLFKRRRVFNTHSIVSRVLELVSGSDRSYINVLHESSSDKQSPAASSFCVARKKVPARAFADVREDLLDLADDLYSNAEVALGLRIYAIDGSTLNLPRQLKDEGFYVAPDNYYPQGLLTTLFRVSDRMICDLTFSSDASERNAAKKLISSLTSKDLVIYDKGFLSFDLLCDHLELGSHGLFRVQSGKGFNEVQAFRESSEEEKIVSISPSISTLAKLRKTRPDGVARSVQLRLMRHRLGDTDHIFATTIVDEAISAIDLINLYYERWKIEELYKAMKNTIRLEEFHSKNLNGVEQEIHAASIVWNISRMVEGFAPNDFKKKPELF